MTQCSGGPAEELAALYLAGELTEPESEDFENHYIGCNPCHQMVLTMQQVQSALAQQPASLPEAMPRPESRNQSSLGRILRFPTPFSGRLVAFGALAAAIIVAAILTGTLVLRNSRSGNSTTAANPVPAANQPSPAKHVPPPLGDPPIASAPQPTEIASLADMHLPGYQAGQLRDAETGSHFEFTVGMANYARGDCNAALIHLSKIPAASEDSLSATLYSGLCELKGNAPAKAGPYFQKVIAAGDTAQLETAEYFLAQAQLLQNDPSGARRWLTKTTALRGDYEDRARHQLKQLSRVSQQP